MRAVALPPPALFLPRCQRDATMPATPPRDDLLMPCLIDITMLSAAVHAAVAMSLLRIYMSHEPLRLKLPPVRHVFSPMLAFFFDID